MSCPQIGLLKSKHNLELCKQMQANLQTISNFRLLTKTIKSQEKLKANYNIGESQNFLDVVLLIFAFNT